MRLAAPSTNTICSCSAAIRSDRSHRPVSTLSVRYHLLHRSVISRQRNGLLRSAGSAVRVLTIWHTNCFIGDAKGVGRESQKEHEAGFHVD